MAQEIKITNLESNPGILPFKLGNAKLRATYHTFLHYFDLKPIETELYSIINHHETIKSVEIKDEPYFTALKSMKNLVSFQLNLATEKLNSLHFHSNNRFKRGIFNALGTVFKSITGNLDSEDGKRFDEAIKILESNQGNIATTLNRQISLTTKIIEDYNKTINLIKQNENHLMDKVREITEVSNNFLICKSALDEISAVANIILQILTDLENAVTFSRLKIVHNSILKLKDLEFIIQKLLQHYSPKELFFGDDISSIQKYYEIIDVQSYYSNNKIVFIIHFPIMYPETYSYYHLYPIPTRNNTIIIPIKPYLVMRDKSFQYEDKECRNIHPIYYCNNKKPLEQPDQEDCIHEILQLNNPTTCKSIPVIIQSEMIEQITTGHYVAVFPEETKIKLNCHKTDLTTLMGTYLIELPTNCSFQTTRNSYTNSEETIIGQPLLLPAIKTSNFPAIHTQQLILHEMSLDEIQKLHQEQQTIHQITLKNMPISSTYTWILPICCIIIIFIFIITFIYKIKHSTIHTNRSSSPNETTIELTKQIHQHPNAEDDE